MIETAWFPGSGVLRDTIRRMKREIETGAKLAKSMRAHAKIEAPDTFAMTMGGKEWETGKEARAVILAEAPDGGFRMTLYRTGM